MKAFAIDRYKSTDGGRIVDLPQPDVGKTTYWCRSTRQASICSTQRSRPENSNCFCRTVFRWFSATTWQALWSRWDLGCGDSSPATRSMRGRIRIGSFAEFIAMSEDDVAIKPKELTMEEAASIPLVGLTAWQALVEKANLKPGEKVFIQAGTGGVGTFAIQLAKHLGATVATTASAANFDLLKGLGADVLIDYKTEDFETRLHDYDVVLHSQDAKTLDKSLRVLKPGGKLISISGPPDPAFAKEIGVPWFVKPIMGVLSFGAGRKAKRQNVTFSFLFMRANGNQLGRITSLIDQGVIRPVVEKVFPFESTKDALAYVEKGRAKGKVVVKVK
jgi:NADPH:quinone reductase-like Zn-dependent oxidoreductase